MNYRIKQQGTVHIFFFVLLLLLASLACQTLLGDSASDSEVATEQIEAVQVIVPDNLQSDEAEVADDSEAADEAVDSGEQGADTSSEEEAAGEEDSGEAAPDGTESDETDVDTADQDSTGTEATAEPADQGTRTPFAGAGDTEACSCRSRGPVAGARRSGPARGRRVQ